MVPPSISQCSIFHVCLDIDLDFNARISREDMFAEREAINAEILSFIQSEGYSLSSNSKNPHSLDSWVFIYTNAGGNKDNIKIEINYSMRQHILPPEYRCPSIPFLDNAHILVLHPIELFASKIKALIERTATRDLYDVTNLIHHPIFHSFNKDMLRKCTLFYMAVAGNRNRNLKEACDLSAIDKLQFKQIRAQLLPMLHHSVFFDYQKAKNEVKEFLQDLMTFTEGEKEFVRRFNDKEYCPELLFTDSDILERISDHPMAIWKTM